MSHHDPNGPRQSDESASLPLATFSGETSSEGNAYLRDPPPQTNGDILNVIHPKSQVDCNLNAFCNELRHSPEAEHARVTSILRYATGGRMMHRFLILHAVKKSGQIFFIRLDRRPRTQELIKLSSQSYMPANDQVGL